MHRKDDWQRGSVCHFHSADTTAKQPRQSTSQRDQCATVRADHQGDEHASRAQYLRRAREVALAQGLADERTRRARAAHREHADQQRVSAERAGAESGVEVRWLELRTHVEESRV